MIERLNNPIQIVLLLAILGIAFGLMGNAARLETAIFDETAHIPAGYSYIKFLDYRLNPEHPPLVKALSAIPLAFMDLNFPRYHPAWTDEVNGQWEVGAQFFYFSGNDADKLVTRARIFPIILTLFTIILIYIWSRELLGKWALLPAFLFGLSPTVLAHGHYVTTDIGATLGVLFATFSFVKFLSAPRLRNVLLAGIALGFSLLAKFSNNLLIPYFLILAIIYFIFISRKNFFKYFGMLIAIFLIAFVFVYAVYFVFILNYPPAKQLNDAATILNTFTPRWLVDIDLALIENPVLRPIGQYLLGLLMILQRAAGGNTAYFLGELSAEGWWYYFPVVFLLKEPLPSLILIFFALGLGIGKILKTLKGQLSKVIRSHLSNYLGTRFAEFSMLLFVIIYWTYSIGSSLNIGVRHILPTLPFIYILSTGAIKSWVNYGKSLVKIIVIITVSLWFLAETIIVSPHFLSYFNQIGGGTTNGYRWVTDSNYDWGQDLKYLADFISKRNNDDDNNNDITKIAVDYFGGGRPKYHIGEDIAENWWSARGNPKDIGIEWLAVSVNTLQGAWSKADPALNRKPEDEYSWLRGQEPFARAGTSIFIYKF